MYTLFGVVLIPVSFLAIRLAENLIHPVVFTRDVDENLTGSQLLTFFVCLAGTLALAASLYVNELTGKRVDERLARSTRGLVVTTAEKYVTAAYLVVLGVILVYVVLYSFKLARLEREVSELAELARRKRAA